ncbi:MAG: MBL fold metallo-hydrolase [Deltaproteobacteria bacterium]|nr:MBL fold metallo-hydrolase [Deltaproteobacteria bacterium]
MYSLNVRFWGVRGSIPTPGAHTNGWGGNTSCVEVRSEGSPPLVFDCGTGALALGDKLVGEPMRELDLVFTHLHMDHLFGFPFFAPLFAPNYRVRIHVPGFSEEDARDKLGLYMNGIYHPVRMRDVPAELVFHSVQPGTAFEAGPWRLTGCTLHHPGGAVGYRVEMDGAVLCYITDTGPFARPGEGVAAGQPPTTAEHRILEFLRGADVAIYDAMYDFDEYLEKMSFGHSYPEYAVAMCEAAGIAEVVLFHHHPNATDDDLDARSATWAERAGSTRVSHAREGSTVEVARSIQVTRRGVVNAEG